MKKTWTLTAISSAILLASCSLSPKPFTTKERLETLKDNSKTLNESRPAIGSHLSLHQAIARAIKYNLDYRVQMAEQAIAQTDMQVTNLNMLPNLVANAGYVDRNNTNYVLSPVTNQISTAESRVRWLSDLSFSWNVLDFGVSYFESKQKADLVLIAETKRRKMIQRLAKDTRNSFWRAHAAANYLQNARGFPDELKSAIRKSQLAEQEKVISPLEAARYRRDLWALYNQITGLQFELARAKPELMSLVNAPPRANVTLSVMPGERLALPSNLPSRLDALEQMALYNRPELQEENYRKRISLNEIHKARVRLLPGFEVNYGSYYDSNSYLVNNTWNQLGLSLSWNILKAFANLKGVTLAQQQTLLADIRRTALSMAIITQVDIAKLLYMASKENVYTAAKTMESEQQIYHVLQNQEQANLETKLTLIKAKAALIFATLRYDIAYAQMQSAAAELLDSVGMDPIYCLDNVNLSADELTKIVNKVLTQGSMSSLSIEERQKRLRDAQEKALKEMAEKKKNAIIVKPPVQKTALKPQPTSKILAQKTKPTTAQSQPKSHPVTIGRKPSLQPAAPKTAAQTKSPVVNKTTLATAPAVAQTSVANPAKLNTLIKAARAKSLTRPTPTARG